MQARHILPLTGIRAFAATWVVLDHFHPWLVMLCPIASVLDRFVKLGYEAVPLFFLLSGFILSYNYFPSYSIAKHPKFLFLRFARLWPVHFTVLILLFLGIGFPFSMFDDVKAISEELLMVRSWVNDGTAWNPPAWSISAEWFAYICIFPFAWLLFSRINRWQTVAAIVALFLVAHGSPLNVFLFPHGLCGTIFFLFFAGSGLYRIRCLVANPPAEIVVICGLVLMLAYIVFSQILPALMLYTAFALLIFGLSYERGFLARFLSTRMMVYGGLISYSLYMTHYLVLRAFIFYSWQHWKQLPHMPLISGLVLVLAACAFIGLAMVSYHYVEYPANRKLRRLLDKPAKV